jgi:multidrug efflux pump subunit AcrA (membrane-fusion protein)
MVATQARPAEDAFRLGLEELVRWMEEDFAFSPQEAYLLLGQVLEARVTQVSDYINPDNRTFKVYVNLPATGEFKPNMLAKVRVRDYEANQALSVPSALVQQDMNGAQYVFVYKAVKGGIGLVEKRPVTIGKNNGSQVEIASGLKMGEILVDKGARTVRDGQSVKELKETSK